MCMSETSSESDESVVSGRSTEPAGQAVEREESQNERRAREGEGTACKDAIVFFVFFVHQTSVKILIGQI